MEPRFGSNFSQVRVHTDEQAARLSAGMDAKAFTVGSHIFFGRGQYQPDRSEGRELIAHELTHTVQQGAVAQRSIQREEGDPSTWDRLTSAAGEVAAKALPNPGDLALKAVGYVAPSLVPIVSRGPGGLIDWLKDKAMSAVQGMFTTLMAPVNVIAGAGQGLAAQFAPLVTSLQNAAGQIAKNDCGPIREAADRIDKAAERLITPVVATLQPIVAAIRNFLSAVWDKLGAPIWNWIKEYAAEKWAEIKAIAQLVSDVARWLWDNTSAIRSVYAQAWGWFKNKLGIGEGPEGEAGLLQWVQARLATAWDSIKVQLAPFNKQITTVAAAVGEVALALSPAGPILALGGAIGGAVQGIRWIAANWGKGNIIATARIYLEQTLIPPLLGAIGRLSATFTNMARSISGALNHLAAAMAGAVAGLGGSILSFAVSAVQWIASQVNALAAWANGQLAQLAVWLQGALGRLQNLLEGVLRFLGRVADVVIDIWGLPVLLGEAIWNRMPACVRDPIVDFLGPIILRQIEIFQELVQNNDAWQETKADVGKIIKLVFHDHDLMGAVRATFFLILRVLNLPPDLLMTVARKALAAWDVVVKQPLAFIKNAIVSLGYGFKILWDNKVENLKIGLQGWLLGEIKEKNIVIPTDWKEPRQLFDFVLSVLGISSEHIFDLMKKRGIAAKTIDGIRSVISRAAGVIAWVDKAIDTTKTPAENARGMVNQARDFGATILSGLAEWVARKVAEEVAIMAAAAAASAGLSELVDIVRRIYRGMLTAVRWSRRILDMANQTLDHVLDIAAGNFAKVGGAFAQIMQRGMPVVIGFLADQVGLSDVGATIRGIVDKLREKVDNAILWVIDKLRSALEKLVGAVKAGVAAVKNWWNERRDFTGADGKPHAIYFTGGENSARLMVASVPEPIESYLKRNFIDPDHPLKTKAEQALDHYDRTIKPLIDKPADQQRAGDLAANITKLSTSMMQLVGAQYGDLPDKQETPVFKAPRLASLRKVSTRNVTTGSDPSGTTPEWNTIVAGGLTQSKGFWKRMHMITHQVGGPGTPDNWVPAPVNVNSGAIVRGFETNLEAMVRKENPKTRKNNVVWVNVSALAFHGGYTDPANVNSYAADKFASSMRFAAGLYYPDKSGNWIGDPTPVLNVTTTIGPPSDEFSGRAPSVNTGSLSQLVAATGAKEWFVREALDVKGKVNFGNIADFQLRLVAARVKQNVERTDEFKAGIEAFRDAAIGKRIRFD
ncbi:eCIS core domain-containing protein [Bradyrhizobium sp. USDA 3315]